jgi:predicted NAD/FAD-binding protein
VQQTTIAVVGSGISGLATAWLLRDRYKVTLFEGGERPGGHTNTIDVDVDGQRFPVDTGFLVFNERTYPNLIAMFDLLGVPSTTSEMSFSVCIEQPRLEWAGTSVASLFAQKRNLLRPRFWRMLADIARFNREAPRFNDPDPAQPMDLGTFLERGRYGDAFRDWYLLPMAAAIWSCPVETMRAFPVASFIRFFVNHGLLQVTRRPRWMTVTGGGREYVRRLCGELADAQADLRLATPVSRVRRLADGVEVTAAGQVERFDQVVFACHSDEALALLSDPTPSETALLGAVRYQPNVAWLHTDDSFLPRSRVAWAAWNYAGSGASGVPGADASASVSVTYLINRLQPLPASTPVMVTLNPHRAVDPARVIRRIEYAHPMLDAPALAAQQQLPAVQGANRTWYCGAWTGYGFHEDGLKSAMVVAAGLGVQAPWSRPAGGTLQPVPAAAANTATSGATSGATSAATAEQPAAATST